LTLTISDYRPESSNQNIPNFIVLNIDVLNINVLNISIKY